MNAFLRVLCVQILFGAFVSSPAAARRVVARPWRSLLFYATAILYGAAIYGALSRWNWLWLGPAAAVFFLLTTGLLATPSTRRLILVHSLQLAPLLGLSVLSRPEEFARLSEQIFSAADSRGILLITLGYLFVIWPSGHLIGAATEPMRNQLEPEKARGLRRAGLWIGRLERLLAYTFILLGQEAAIAFLVTAKSVFRFGEIKDPNNRRETEYILIGSLVSFSVAMIAGYVVRMLVGSRS